MELEGLYLCNNINIDFTQKRQICILYSLVTLLGTPVRDVGRLTLTLLVLGKYVASRRLVESSDPLRLFVSCLLTFCVMCA